MELPTGLNRRYASFAIFLLVAIWCWVAFDRPYIFPDHVPWNIYSNGPQSNPSTDVFDYPPISSAAIRKVCANTQFNESIIFTCDNSGGNVADVRNSILHCVRYAIAGGGSLRLPRIMVAVEGAGLKTANKFEMEYMFDTLHFAKSLSLSCPKFRVYQSIDETPGRLKTNAPISLVPESIETKDKDGKILAGEWKAAFTKWLAQYLTPDTEGPVIISLARSYLQYPISSDEPAFVSHFGKILKVREDARTLATTALVKMSAAYAPRMDVQQPIIHKSFVGAYLSTQNHEGPTTDAERIEARYNAQSKLYLKLADQANLTVMYLASDENSFITKFIRDANETGIAITTKFDLVKGKDREDLLAMGSEQQALVDFLVLSKASDFGGVGYSSLAWNVALRRHEYSEQEENWLNTGEALLADELSQIYGAPGSDPEFINSMWP